MPYAASDILSISTDIPRRQRRPTTRMAHTSAGEASTTPSPVGRGEFPSLSPGCDVLVVEDDPAIRDQLAERMRDEGYTVLTAGDGRAALDIIQRGPVGLVVLDLMLPRMSGWELLDVLRPTGGMPRVPTLVITAFSNAHSATGAPVFLKPLNTNSLLRAVRAYIGERH
jgi:CheY-like chemotaxis protein